MKIQIINRGYLTYALTDEHGNIYGTNVDHFINVWDNINYYWSEVFVDCGTYQIHRKGILLTNPSNERLKELHKQSKINLNPIYSL